MRTDQGFPIFGTDKYSTRPVETPTQLNEQGPGFVRPQGIMVFSPAVVFNSAVLNVAEPTLVKFGNWIGMARGPGLIAATDEWGLRIEARGGADSTRYNQVDPINRIVLQSNRGYMFLPHAGQWSLLVEQLGVVLGTRRIPWIAYEGVSAEQYQAILRGGPSETTTGSVLLAANERFMVNVTPRARHVRLGLAAAIAGASYTIPTNAAAAAIPLAVGMNDIPFDLLGPAAVMVNGGAGGTIEWQVGLD